MIAANGVARTNYVALEGLHVPPYTNWLTAATNIQDAVDVAADGDWVLVWSGVYCTGGAVMPGYTLMNRVCVTNAVWLRGVFGPDATWIVGAPDAETGGNGSNAVRGVYLSNGATMEGFSVTGGYTQTTGAFALDRCAGGILAGYGSVVTNCRAVGNRAEDFGGGIMLSSSWCVATLVVSNTGVRWGGGIYAVDRSCVDQSRFLWNGSAYGGGVFLDTSEIGNSFLSSNSAYMGGAIHTFSRGTNAMITNCVIVHNYSSGVADGISLEHASILDSLIASNGIGIGFGHGVRMRANTLAVRCRIVGNSASQIGGGILMQDGAVISECLVSNNRCAHDGGGVCCAGGGVVLNSVICGNEAGQYGGGVYMYAGGAVSNCVIRENRAGGSVYSGGGGGVCLQNGGNVYNSVLMNNRVYPAPAGLETALGGGAYLWAGGGVHNCLIVSNWASERNSGGGGVACSAGGGVVNNCTIMHNEGRDNGGGVLGNALVRNSIVFYNRSFGAAEHDGAQFEYSCTRPLPAGAGNITNAPLLMADYQELPESPTVNAGKNAYAAGLWDLAGTNRILFGVVDMGCYECTVPEGGLGLVMLITICELRMAIWQRKREQRAWRGASNHGAGKQTCHTR